MATKKEVKKPERRGRAPEYGDPNVLRKKVDDYFAECETKFVFADFAGMCLFLKLSYSQVEDLCDPGITEDSDKYKEIFNYAMMRRESLLMRKMVADPKAATGCKAALALPENGGHSEKAVAKPDRRINIKSSKETEELFK